MAKRVSILLIAAVVGALGAANLYWVLSSRPRVIISGSVPNEVRAGVDATLMRVHKLRKEFGISDPILRTKVTVVGDEQWRHNRSRPFFEVDFDLAAGGRENWRLNASTGQFESFITDGHLPDSPYRHLDRDRAVCAVRDALAAVGVPYGDLRFSREMWISQAIFRRGGLKTLLRERLTFSTIEVDCWRANWALRDSQGRWHRGVVVVALDGTVTVLTTGAPCAEPAPAR